MNTAHASLRCQQRGIPPIVIDMLLQFGRREHDHSGAEVVYFDRNARKQVERYAGGLIGRLSEHLDSYAVVAAGKIITAGTRYKRIKHHEGSMSPYQHDSETAKSSMEETNHAIDKLESLVQREGKMQKVDVESPVTVTLYKDGKSIDILHDGVRLTGAVKRPLIHQLGSRAWGQQLDFREVAERWAETFSQDRAELEREVATVFRNHALSIRYETDDRGINNIYGIVSPQFVDVNQMEFRAAFVEQARHSTALLPESERLEVGRFGEVIEFFKMRNPGFQTEYKYGLVYARNNGYEAYKVNWGRLIVVCTNGLTRWEGERFAWKHTKEVDLSQFIAKTVDDGIGNQEFLEKRISAARSAQLSREIFDELMERLSLGRASKSRLVERLAVESEVVGQNEWALSQALTWLASHKNALAFKDRPLLTDLGTDILELSLPTVLSKERRLLASGSYGLVLPKDVKSQGARHGSK